ncbi:MAG: GHKL domain-containing protein [Clostridia bacterium]|nr:GHKL domain-containing protein [Clostridia bacterium]
MRKKTYLKLVEVSTEQSRRHLEEVRSIHSEMRGFKHDFRHHLLTLRGQLESGEVSRALEYIENLDDKLSKTDTLLKTGNVSADAILSAKISQAKAANILVSIKATIPDNLKISDVDFSIVLGNLLDNAIEAAEKSGSKRFIRIYIAPKGNMLYFSMLNSSGKKLSKKNGLFASAKEGLHGFGLKRAKAIIEDHGGWIKYNSEDEAFTTEFLVPVI